MSKGKIIQLTFVAVSFLLSALIWSYTSNNVDLTAGLDIIRIMVFLTCFVALAVLAIAISSEKTAYAMYGAFILGYLLFSGLRLEYLIGAAISFLIFVGAVNWAIKNTANNVKPGFYPFVRYGAPQIITAAAVLFALAAYLYPINFSSIQLPREFLAPAMPMIEKIIASSVPGYQPGMTIDQFFSAGAEAALDQATGGKAIPKQMIAAALEEEIKKQRENLSARLGMKLSGNEKLEDIIFTVSNDYLNHYLIRYSDIAPAVVAVLIFLTIKSLGFFIDRLAVFIAWLAARILLSSGVIQKQKISVEKEILTV